MEETNMNNVREDETQVSNNTDDFLIGKFIKGLAVALFIIGFVVSCAVTKDTPITFITTFVVFTIICVILMGIGTIINLLVDIRNELN